MSTSSMPTPREHLAAFGALVKQLRLARGLTQEELAERAFVSARLISDLERGTRHRPRRDTVNLLADGLGLTGPERDRFTTLARGSAPAASQPSDAHGSALTGWPIPPTSFIGRDGDITAVVAALLQPDVRLLTLTGPGGIGKTRLAFEAAARAAPYFPDGAFLVDLTSLREASLVRQAVAQAISRQQPHDPVGVDGLGDWLLGKRVLIVVDNFEHILEAAPDIADLLAHCAGLTILATSRALLRLRAEHAYELDPLGLPRPGDEGCLDRLRRVPAVELFMTRARAVNREFALTPANAATVARLAATLDGLPLAIELAAARIRVLSPAALLGRLDHRLALLTGGAVDLPPRQQTMRAAIAWSYDLLGPAEQRQFRWLAVYDGSFTVEAADAIAGRPDDCGNQVLDGLTTLVEQSLLRTTDDPRDGPRFQMLALIREFGLDALAAAGEEEAARASHAAWCVVLAERAEPFLTGSEQEHWFARVDSEHDSLRAALRWSVAQDEAEIALRLVVALYRYWATTGQYQEGDRWLALALACGPDAPAGLRANALLGAGVMAYFQGRYDDAGAAWTEAKALFETQEDVRGIAYSLGNLGLLGDAAGDFPRAVACYEAALALFRQLEDETYVGFMLHNIGLIAHFEGDQARATALFEESLDLARRRDDANSIAMTLGNLSLVRFVQGDYPRALALQLESLRTGSLSTNRSWLAKSLENLALIAAATGRPARAARYFGSAGRLRAEIGSSLPAHDRAFNERYQDAARSQLGADAYAAAYAEGEAMSGEEAMAHALARESIRGVA